MNIQNKFLNLLFCISLGFSVGCSTNNSVSKKDSAPTEGTAETFTAEASAPTTGNAKALYQSIHNDITIEEILGLMGTPQLDVEGNMVFWKSKKISLWFDRNENAQIFAPAFVFKQGSSADLDFDSKLEKEILNNYISAKAPLQSAISKLGEPDASHPYRYVRWEFNNGDNVEALFEGELDGAGQMQYYYKVSNLDQKVVSSGDETWNFVTTVSGASGQDWVVVTPKIGRALSPELKK